MIFQEITSRDIKITSPLSDVSVSSRIVETKTDESRRTFWGKFAFTLSEIMQIESASNRFQSPEFETQTVFTDRIYKKAQLLLKISEAIDKIMDEEELFKGVNKYKLLETISKMLNGVSIDWDNISDRDFFERIKRILTLEAMSGILKELKPEQIEAFDEAIKRRALFK